MKDQSSKATYLVYKTAGIEDVVNPLSPKGYETIGDDLACYLDYATIDIVSDGPVVLEITGYDFDDDARSAVTRAIRAHYTLQLAQIDLLMRSCRIKTAWFLLSFVLSSVLLFFATHVINELAIQYLYLPFWFFGYRVLTYPIFDYLPARKERKAIVQMCSMSLVFTGEYSQGRGIAGRLQANQAEAVSHDQERQFVRDCFMEGETVCLECNVRTMDDLIRSSSVPGREIISDNVTRYLEQAEPFVKKDANVRLTVSGCLFGNEEKGLVVEVVRAHFASCLQRVKQQIRDNFRKIGVFIVCLLLVGLIFLLLESGVNVATRELILIAFWFFGDYLIEFALVDHLALRNKERTYSVLSSMDIVFK